MQKTAIVTGVSGQDGYYLSKLLREKGYRVVGTTSGDLNAATVPWVHELRKLNVTDSQAIQDLIKELKPDEVYNLAARASSAQLFDDPELTGDVNGLSVTRWLSAISWLSPHSKFCQAVSSEIFAGASESPQNEDTCIAPVNAYGAAKAYALHMVQAFRLQKNIFACAAIVYSHESPRRSLHFVTRKISNGLAKIVLGLEDSVTLGSLTNRRDWCHAQDVVRGMYLMLQSDKPEDYILASNQTRSIAEFCDIAFKEYGLDYRDYVKIDSQIQLRVENIILQGDSSKAKRNLAWTPEIDFPNLVKQMVASDIQLLKDSNS